MASSGMRRRVGLVRIDVSEERVVFIFRVERICKLEITLVTSYCQWLLTSVAG
jgi:hypothetical protein